MFLEDHPFRSTEELIERQASITAIIEAEAAIALEWGVTSTGLERLEQTALTLNVVGQVVIPNFFEVAPAEALAVQLPSGTQTDETIANSPLVNFLFKVLVVGSNSDYNGPPDAFVATTNGITPHRDHDIVNTALLTLHTGPNGITYHFHYTPKLPGIKRLQVIPAKSSTVKNKELEKLELARFEPTTHTLFAGDLLLIGAHSLCDSMGDYYSVLHSAISQDGNRATLGIYKK